MTKLKCCVPGCDRVAKVAKHMLCNTHLVRYYRNGNPGSAQIKPKKRDRYAAYQAKPAKTTKYQKHKPYGDK